MIVVNLFARYTLPLLECDMLIWILTLEEFKVQGCTMYIVLASEWMIEDCFSGGGHFPTYCAYLILDQGINMVLYCATS